MIRHSPSQSVSEAAYCRGYNYVTELTAIWLASSRIKVRCYVKTVDCLKKAADDVEQYSRRQNLLFRRLPEVPRTPTGRYAREYGPAYHQHGQHRAEETSADADRTPREEPSIGAKGERPDSVRSSLASRERETSRCGIQILFSSTPPKLCRILESSSHSTSTSTGEHSKILDRYSCRTGPVPYGFHPGRLHLLFRAVKVTTRASFLRRRTMD